MTIAKVIKRDSDGESVLHVTVSTVLMLGWSVMSAAIIGLFSWTWSISTSVQNHHELDNGRVASITTTLVNHESRLTRTEECARVEQINVSRLMEKLKMTPYKGGE